MPTRTADEHPFAPRRAITRDELLAYAEGRLPPERMREVEQALEADVLLRDAAEGLRMPGARIGLDALDAARPSGARAMNGWVVGSLVAVIGIAACMILASDDTKPLAERGGTAPTIPEPLAPMRAEEIATAHEQPESLLIVHERLALHAQPLRQRSAMVDPEPAERDGGIESALATRAGDRTRRGEDGAAHRAQAQILARRPRWTSLCSSASCAS